MAKLRKKPQGPGKATPIHLPLLRDIAEWMRASGIGGDVRVEPDIIGEETRVVFWDAFDECEREIVIREYNPE